MLSSRNPQNVLEGMSIFSDITSCSVKIESIEVLLSSDYFCNLSHVSYFLGHLLL